MGMYAACAQTATTQEYSQGNWRYREKIWGIIWYLICDPVHNLFFADNSVWFGNPFGCYGFTCQAESQRLNKITTEERLKPVTSALPLQWPKDRFVPTFLAQICLKQGKKWQFGTLIFGHNLAQKFAPRKCPFWVSFWISAPSTPSLSNREVCFWITFDTNVLKTGEMLIMLIMLIPLFSKSG